MDLDNEELEKTKKIPIRIVNEGCHDDTETDVEVTEEELNFLVRIAKENNKNSDCTCQPRLRIFIKHTKQVNVDYYEDDLTKEGE